MLEAFGDVQVFGNRAIAGSALDSEKNEGIAELRHATAHPIASWRPLTERRNLFVCAFSSVNSFWKQVIKNWAMVLSFGCR